MNELPPELRNVIVNYGCHAIGRRQKRNNEPWDEHRPYGELFHDLTVDDLCDQIAKLVDEAGLLEDFIIPAVLDFIIQFLERASDSDVADRRLDDSLQMLANMEHELSIPMDDRRVPATDDVLKRMISQLKEGMLRAPKYKEQCQDIADSIGEMKNSVFSNEYWEEWSEFRMRRK